MTVAWEVAMGASVQGRMLRQMCRAVDDDLDVVVRQTWRPRPAVVSGSLVGHRPGSWFYDVDAPEDRPLADDTSVEIATEGRRVTGRVVAVDGDRRTLALEEDLGPRFEAAALTVDERGPLEALRVRLAALADAPGRRSAPVGGLRVDQAAQVLGAAVERLRDAVARTAETAANREGDGEVVTTALRNRATFVGTPAGTDRAGLLAHLLDRLLQAGATVLFVSTSNAAVDTVVAGVCERLGQRSALRSAVVQRIGAIGSPALADRFGPLVSPTEVAADLHSALDERAATLDREDLELRHQEAVLRHEELRRTYADLAERLDHALRRRGLRRLITVGIGPADKPDALLVAMHKMRPRLKKAVAERDKLAAEVAGGQTTEVGRRVSLPAARIGARRREIAEALRTLDDARRRIDLTLRRRCRLVATTAPQTWLRRLPRPSFDVVVVDDVTVMPAPVAFYVAGLSARSVVAVGELDSMPSDQAPFLHDRIPAGVVGASHQHPDRTAPHLVTVGAHRRALGTSERRRPSPASMEHGLPNPRHGWSAPT